MFNLKKTTDHKFKLYQLKHETNTVIPSVPPVVTRSYTILMYKVMDKQHFAQLLLDLFL